MRAFHKFHLFPEDMKEWSSLWRVGILLLSVTLHLGTSCYFYSLISAWRWQKGNFMVQRETLNVAYKKCIELLQHQITLQIL